MAVGDETRLSPGLWLVTRALLVIWLVVAAFPLVWMAAMSIRLPVDAFSSNPLQVLLGPRRRVSPAAGRSALPPIIIARSGSTMPSTGSS